MFGSSVRSSASGGGGGVVTRGLSNSGIGNGNNQKYVIEKNDTVISVAVKFGMTQSQFRILNRLPTNAFLFPGQVVTVKCKEEDASKLNSSLSSNEGTTSSPKAIPTSSSSITTTSSASSTPSKLLRSISTRQENEIYKQGISFVTQKMCVSGILTLTSELLIFEPHSNEKAVEQYGLVKCQYSCFPIDVVDARILQLSYFERCSLGMGDLQVVDDNQYYLQISLKEDPQEQQQQQQQEADESSQSEESMSPSSFKPSVAYFIVNVSDLPTFENNFKRFVKNYVENANEIVRRKLRYGPVVTRKLLLISQKEGKNEEEDEEQRESSGFAMQLMDHSNILKESDCPMIDSLLPARSRFKKWDLLFSKDKHGIWMDTFYNKCRDVDTTLLIVKDDKDAVFGAYLTEPWQKRKDFYGTGECILFKLHPPPPTFWKWTEKNNFFMFSTDNEIAVGGGRTGFGLRVGSDWGEGSSVSCETYNNEPLSSTEHFFVSSVEIWGMIYN